MGCDHPDTHNLPEPWPTGESIEVCNCCGMSRAHHEWHQSPWIEVDLYESRDRMELMMQAVMDTARRIHDSEEHH
ncbi:MAG: hypothetical protein KAR40_07985 [Candidatus Sabulitectum sp.]|nr:hypothetical protein [Candidatus Sabulitectum sp.]